MMDTPLCVCVCVNTPSVGPSVSMIRRCSLSFSTSFYPGVLSLFSLTVQFPYISQDIKLTEIKLP